MILPPGRIFERCITRNKAFLLFCDSQKLGEGRDVKVHGKSTLGVFGMFIPLGGNKEHEVVTDSTGMLAWSEAEPLVMQVMETT